MLLFFFPCSEPLHVLVQAADDQVPLVDDGHQLVQQLLLFVPVLLSPVALWSFTVFKKHGKNKQSKKSKAETSQIVKQLPGTNFRHLICEVLQRLRSRYLLYTEFAATKRRKNDSKGLVHALDVQLSSHFWSSAVMKLLPLCGKWSNCLKFAGWIASSSTKLLTTALMTALFKSICAADIRGGDLINTRKAAFCASQCSRVHRRQKKKPLKLLLSSIFCQTHFDSAWCSFRSQVLF